MQQQEHAVIAFRGRVGNYALAPGSCYPPSSASPHSHGPADNTHARPGTTGLAFFTFRP